MWVKWYKDRLVYSEAKESQQGETFSPPDLIEFLWEPLEISPGVTLRDLLTVVEDDIDCWAMVIQNPFLTEVIDEFLATPSDSYDLNEDISKICLCWRCESDDINGTYPRVFSLDMDVYGKKDGDDESYAIEFLPLSDLLGAELETDSQVEMHRDREYGTTDSLGERVPSVIEVFRAMIEELTCNGTPAERDARRDDLGSRLREAQSGEVRLIPFEELKKRLMGGLKDQSQSIDDLD